MRKFLFMATLALLATSCQVKEDTTKAPITKPEITIQGGRLTPEALWAMGRINSVHPNPQGDLAYTISYYSVEENRSTSWIRIARETKKGELIISELFWTIRNSKNFINYMAEIVENTAEEKNSEFEDIAI